MSQERVLDAWDLAPVLDVSRVEAGSVNRVFRVRTAASLFFLRAYRTADVAVVEREHSLIAHMRLAGVPAVAPVAARDGRTVVAVDGALHALYPQAGGVQPSRAALTPQHAVAAGAMLALIHNAARGLPDAGYRRYRLEWDGEAWLARLGGIEQAILARPRLDETDRWALERVRAQQRWLADPDCPHRCTPHAPAQVTHGDYHDANLFFGGRDVSGIIDWEQAAWMSRAFEVVRAAAYMFDLRPAPTRAFLQAYCAHSGMGSEELGEGTRAWGVMSDHYVWAPEEVYLHGNERARRFIPHRPFRPFLRAWADASLEGFWGDAR